MPYIDPPYPSFSFVMAKARVLSTNNARLHYHPYTMVCRPSPVVQQLQDATLGGSEDPIIDAPAVARLNPLIVRDDDVSEFELDLPLVDDECVREWEATHAQHEADRASRGRKLKFLTAFMNWMSVVEIRRRYLALAAVVDFLKRRQPE
ncbi:hypothetical protein C8Q80DRAFT_93877 [Daedaleopsis nitida]|nr:hypothetical protein C8Q80DRAFT_93877 [Daedaleopsis nitida]